jgi:hypothetical protein
MTASTSFVAADFSRAGGDGTAAVAATATAGAACGTGIQIRSAMPQRLDAMK